MATYKKNNFFKNCTFIKGVANIEGLEISNLPEVAFLGRSNVEKVRADLAQIEKALELFRFNEMRYPNTNEGLRALVEAP